MKKMLASLLAVIMLISLVGCSPVSKPENTVTKFCDALKTFDMETASSCFVSGDANIENIYAEEDSEEQSLFTEQAVEYLMNCAKEMTYVLGEATTEDDKAVIPVTFTYVDASSVISAALGEYITQAFALAFSGADDSVMEELFSTIFMEKTESVNAGTATSSVEFVCIKQDNEWKIQELSKDVQDTISNMISCNIVKAIESFGNKFNDDNSSDSEEAEDYVWYDVPAGQV